MRKKAEETPEKKPSVRKTRTKAENSGIQPREKPNRTAKKPSGVRVSRTPEAKQSNQKKTLTANANDYSHLPIKKRLFIEAFCSNGGNRTKAAISAGYSPGCAGPTGSDMYKELEPYITHILESHIEAIAMSRERVLREVELMTSADANDLVEVRIVCCRHCWGGPEFKYQETPAELRERTKQYDRDCEKAEQAEKEPPVWDDDRVLGFNGTKPPNPECPECWGEGVEQVKLKDSTKLSPAARAIYAGAKFGKYGIEVNMHSKEKAVEVLAKHHKLYEDKTEVNFIALDEKTLEEKYASKMREAHERQSRVISERESKKDS